MPEGALAGLRVLDFTHYVAGPYATKLLGDYGADVIKIERPEGGDPARRLGPFKDDDPQIEKSGLFLYLNNNKRSLTLNLKTERGWQIAQDLARRSDIVVENFRPGVMDRLGLDYETMAAANPAIVMVSLSNFGQDGPYRDDRASPLILFAMGGEMYSLGGPDRPPVNQYPMATLVQAGAMASVAAMAGLAAATANGEGTHADVSIFETHLSSQDRRVPALVAYQFSGLVSERVGSGSLGYPIGVYPCADGYIEIAGASHWDRVVHMLGDPPALLDPKWKAPDAPVDLDLKTEFESIFYPWLLERTKLEVWEAAQHHRVLCGPLLSMEDVAANPAFRKRDFWTNVEHAVMGEVEMPGRPFIMETPWELRRPAPLLGEHTAEILGELGYSPDGVVGLRQQGVV